MSQIDDNNATTNNNINENDVAVLLRVRVVVDIMLKLFASIIIVYFDKT